MERHQGPAWGAGRRRRATARVERRLTDEHLPVGHDRASIRTRPPRPCAGRPFRRRRRSHGSRLRRRARPRHRTPAGGSAWRAASATGRRSRGSHRRQGPVAARGSGGRSARRRAAWSGGSGRRAQPGANSIGPRPWRSASQARRGTAGRAFRTTSGTVGNAGPAPAATSLARISSFEISSPFGIARRSATWAGLRIPDLELAVPAVGQRVHEDDAGGLRRETGGRRSGRRGRRRTPRRGRTGRAACPRRGARGGRRPRSRPRAAAAAIRSRPGRRGRSCTRWRSPGRAGRPASTRPRCCRGRRRGSRRGQSRRS